jgi:PAS domain S-box-containing protein
VLLHDDGALEKPQSLFEEIKTSAGLIAKEVSRKRKDGSVFSAIMSSSIIYNEKGEQLLLSATVIDITERKEMEQALVELNATLEERIVDRTKALQSSNEELMSEIKTRQLFEEQLQAKSQELQTFFDVSLDLMCIADVEGNFLKLNKAWEELLGYEIQSLEQRKFLDFVHPDDLATTLEAMSKLNSQELVLNFTNRYRTSRGSYRFIEWHSVPVGNLVYAAARDITERIEQADVLRKAQLQAEEANKSKSEFLSRMSHELRTPLNSILGFAQLLEMGQLAEQQQKGVGHILKSGKHLLDLINEVLDISRIEAGRISISVEPVEVLSILHEVADLLSPYASSRNIQVHVMGKSSERVFAQADKQRLKQIITNLLNNALKYNVEGGEVWVHVEVLELAHSAGKIVRIALRDTGVGIAAQDLEKIFNPFERLTGMDGQVEGTGLGLTVVKQLVELIGGRVWVESEPGVGSTFYVDLLHVEPVLTKKAQGLVLEQPSVGAVGNAGVVLYIEDNPSNVELIEQVLLSQRSDLKLVTSAFGTQTVDLALAHLPKLILLDLNLPDEHGSEVLLALKANPATSSIPVIVISADAMPNQISQMMELGAANYLTKPLDLSLFLHEIERYTQS